MTHKERFVRYMLGEKVDRPPYWAFWSPWGTTLERWKREGMPEDITAHNALFDPDPNPISNRVPVNFGPCPVIESKIISEDDTSYIHVDGWGIKRRNLKGRETMSEFLEFPVKSRKDWEKLKEERLNPDDDRRLEGNWKEIGNKWMGNGEPIQLGNYPYCSVFGSVRWLLGDEECLVAFYTMPDLVHEIMDHMTSIFITVFEKVVKEIEVDVIHIWEDMCGRQGPLISPKHWEEFMGSPYRRIRDFAKKHSIPLISVDTDGDPDLITPPMMNAGVNFLFPMEVAAGCDVNEWQKKYPLLAMMGGIDKRALAQGHDAIDRELKRIKPAVAKGRYVPDLDHLIPDDVSWDNYCYYARELKKLVGKT